jgi:hypothetical protein
VPGVLVPHPDRIADLHELPVFDSLKKRGALNDIFLAVKRFPRLDLTGEKLRWKPGMVLRGLKALPLAF